MYAINELGNTGVTHTRTACVDIITGRDTEVVVIFVEHMNDRPHQAKYELSYRSLQEITPEAEIDRVNAGGRGPFRLHEYWSFEFYAEAMRNAYHLVGLDFDDWK